MTFEGYRRGDVGLRRVSIALFAGAFSSFGLLYCTQPLLPGFSAAFGITESSAALSISFATLTLGIAMLFAGQLSEVIGRTRMMRISLVSAAFLAAATAFVTDWTTMLVLRTLLGLLLAGFPAVALAYLREEVHPSAHASATGLYVAGTALGGMTGRLVSGGLAQIGDWRTAMIGTAAYGLLCAIAVLVTLPDSRNFHPAPRSIHSSLTAFVGVLKDRYLLGMYAMGLLTLGAYVAVFNITGYRLESAPYLLPVGIAGLVYLVTPIGAVASIYAGRLSERFGPRRVIPASCVIFIAGVAITFAAPLWVFMLGLAVLTTGFFGVHSVVSGWVSARAFAVGRSTGSAASMYLFAYYLGSSVLGTLAGTAWRYGGWTLLASCCVGVVFLAFLISLGLRRTPAAARP